MDKLSVGYCLLILSFFTGFFRAGAFSLDHQAYVNQEPGQHLESINRQLDTAIVLFKQEDYATALEKYTGILKLIQPLGNNELLGKTIRKIGQCHERMTRYAEALDYYNRFLTQIPEITPKDRAKVQSDIASIYQRIGDYEASYDFQLKSFETMESIKDSMGMAKALYKLGTLFYYQESYQQALSFYKRSLAICEQLKESEKSSFHCLGGIGTAFSSLGKQEEALEYHYKALSIARKYNLRKGEAYTLHNIGAVHLISKEYETALNYFTKSLMIKKELKDSWGEVGSYQYLGDLYLATGQFGMAISYFEKGLSLSKKIESDTRLKDLYRLLAKAHHLKGNHDQSYHYFNKFSALRDSMYNAELLEKMTNMQERYEIQRRVSEIKSLKNENHILEQEKVIQQLNRRYLVFGFICLFLLTLALFLLYKNIIQNKWNKQLAVKNEEIQYKNKRLEFKNEELRKFAFIASHDLKAPLRTIGSFTGLLRRRYGKMFDETADEYMGFIIEATKRMYQLLDDLLKYSNLDKLAEGTVDQGMDLEKWLDTREVIDVALSNLAYHIKKEEADIEILSGEFPSIRANPSHMVQVFQNIIANGIKFKGEEKPKIHIDCATNGSQHIFSIKDNGIGIAPEFKDKIFDMFSRLHLLGKYEGTGIGLATCKRIINRLGGKIWVESEEGKGSTFFFTVPRIAK